MKKGIAKFTAFCLAAGFVFAEGSSGLTVVYADTVLAGFDTSKSSRTAKAVKETETSAEETGSTGEETSTEETGSAGEDTSADAASKESTGETEAETSAPVDKSMVGTMGFAQTDSYLNVRASGDTDGEVIGKVYNNGSVEILDVDDNGWYYIKSGNVEGYVAGQYVATGGTAEKIAEDTGYTTAEVGADILNVRRDPSEDSDVVDTVSSSNHLEVVEDDGDWVKVVTDAGIYGYVSTDYVNVTTDYATGETVEEEQERLNKEWLEYLAQQEAAAQAAAASQAAADASYTDSSYTDTSSADQAYSDAQAAADAAAAEAQAQADAAAQAQAEADAAAAQAQAAQDAAAQAASTDVDSLYQAYLTAQSAADEAVANGSDTDTINATAQAAQDAYAVYVEAQNQADAAAQAAADAQAQADAAAQAQADAEAAAQAQADAEAAAAAAAQEASEAQAQAAQTEAPQTEAENTSSGSSSSGSSLGAQVAAYATQFVGNPYVWGGSSLTGGADCSGFTMAVYSQFGVSLPHSAAAQSGYGSDVSLSDLQPGDLLFYDNGGGIGHVTMYIGNGQVVHASSSTTGIIISSVDYRTPVCARRLV
jgi:cell wall-associated NlpC family hydrolase/SH3-like domain-containing protein